MDSPVSESTNIAVPSPSEARPPTLPPAKTPAKRNERPKKSKEIGKDAEKEKKSRISWTDKMEEILIYSLLHEVVHNGKRADSGYKNEAWDVAADAIRDHIGHDQPAPTKLQMQAKHDWYKKMWKLWLDLEAQSGFGYDSEKDLLTAPDATWKEYCRVRRIMSFSAVNLLTQS